MQPSTPTTRRRPAPVPSKRRPGSGTGAPVICSPPGRSMRAVFASAPTRSAVLRPPARSVALVRVFVAGAVAIWTLIGSPSRAHAHVVGVSRGDYRVNGAEIVARLTFSRTELALAVPAVESYVDGEKGEPAREPLGSWLLAGLRTTADRPDCPGKLGPIS